MCYQDSRKSIHSSTVICYFVCTGICDSDKPAIDCTLCENRLLILIFSFQLFQLAVTVSVLYYGGHLVLTGMLTGGTLISFILYQIQLGDCLNVSRVPTSSGNHGKSRKKFHAWKNHGISNKLNNHGKIMEFC